MAVAAYYEICLALYCTFKDAIVVRIVRYCIQNERWVHNSCFALELREKRAPFILWDCKFSV